MVKIALLSDIYPIWLKCLNNLYAEWRSFTFGITLKNLHLFDELSLAVRAWYLVAFRKSLRTPQKGCNCLLLLCTTSRKFPFEAWGVTSRIGMAFVDSFTPWYRSTVKSKFQPIRIWVVTRHQYGISALVSQTSFRGETSGDVAICRLFSQAIHNSDVCVRKDSTMTQNL